MKIHWATHFKIVGGNGYGYTVSNAYMRNALTELGVEQTGDASVAVHLCHPVDFKPIPDKKNILFCLAPETRLLTSDLRWVAINDIKPGDELIGPDEDLSGRKRPKMRRSKVLAISRQIAPRYKITTDKGEVIATPNHQWVTRRKTTKRFKKMHWRRTEDLQIGDSISYYTSPWNIDESYDSRWMAGALDGEGFVSNPVGRGTNVGFVQNPGIVLDKFLDILKRDGFEYKTHVNETNKKNGYSGSVSVLIRGPGANLRILGKYRPSRLLKKASMIWEGKSATHKGTRSAIVLGVERIEDGPVCGLATETKTIVAEGMLSHNTMFEGEPVPDDFPKGFMKADAIFTPSNFSYDLFDKLRGKKPMFISKLGFDDKLYTFKERTWNPETDTFQWLWIGAPNARKGWPYIMSAWAHLFQDENWCNLTFKTSTETGEGKAFQRGNISFDSRRYEDPEQMKDLYHAAHAFVLPTLGEGFGLTALEAMATGAPTIVTNYGGQIDFANDETAWTVKYQMDECVQTDGSIWIGAIPDVPDIGKKMLEIVSDYPKALEKAKVGSDYVQRNFTWKEAAKQLVENIERLGYGN